MNRPTTPRDEDADDEREMGVEFGDLRAALRAESYPLTNEQLLAEYGDEFVGVGDGDVSLRELLEPLGDETHEDAADVEQSVFNMVDREAVGRQRYSDRGGTAADRGGQAEDAEDSF